MKKLLLAAFVLSLCVACSPKQELYLIETDLGTMTVKLYDSTPQHRDNFKKLVSEAYYDDLLFHRVMAGFMVQGGDPESRNAPASKRLGGGGPPYKIPAEIGAYHFKGALSAARQGDQVNPEKKSSGSQFFLVQGKVQSDADLKMMAQRKGLAYSAEDIEKYKTIGGTPFLDNDYTVFGEVVDGMDVIDKIAAVKTAPGDRPLKDVKMKIRKK
jgi:peptidyl-prolyl cis-trans isomerase B (cyclophilin B)